MTHELWGNYWKCFEKERSESGVEEGFEEKKFNVSCERCKWGDRLYEDLTGEWMENNVKCRILYCLKFITHKKQSTVHLDCLLSDRKLTHA